MVVGVSLSDCTSNILSHFPSAAFPDQRGAREERAGARAGSVSPGRARSVNTIRTPRPSPTRRPSRAPCAPTRARSTAAAERQNGPYVEPRFSREGDGRGGASPLRVWRATSVRTGPPATQPVYPAAPPFTGCGPRRGGHLSAEHKEARHFFFFFFSSLFLLLLIRASTYF
jgi:hypothetical protein